MKKDLKQSYVKYKKQLTPIIFLALSLFIIFGVIVPQLSAVSESSRQIQNNAKDVEELKKTLSVVASQNEADLTSDLSTSLKALPHSKDITLIFGALSSSAASSQIQLREFSLEVGGLFGGAQASSVNIKGSPSVNVIARVSAGNPFILIKFSNEIQKRLPLAQVTQIDANEALATFNISFYYKPLDLTLISREPNAAPLTQADSDLINKLKEWDEQ